MRYTGPKNRIARRENLDLGLKTPGSKSQANLLKKINISPGQHGTKGRRKLSEHSKQLREKQKLRYMFGVTEKQMKNYFSKSVTKTGNTGLFLCQFLEQRLDNVVYRLGLAPTRASARQLISHKHMAVNAKPVHVASYHLRPGDVITFIKEESAKIPYIDTSLTKKDVIMAPWISRDGNSGTLVQQPDSDIIAKQINLRLVVEFYSR